MPCPKGCCESYKEHIKSIGLRPNIPKPKITVDHTDDTINTTTEHWNDRQDLHVRVREPVTRTLPKELKDNGRD